MGGSEHVEAVTDELERGVAQYLSDIEQMGGTLRAIETGYIQNEIQNSAYQYQRAVETGERVVVGVNRFQQEDERGVPVFRLDPTLERGQVERLREMRAGRSAGAVQESLDAMERVARDGGNLMAPILDAARAYATVGEIADRLRTVFGEYREG
jgi:methylmalonyl-CoA mutase N-terminal domain/subunit